MATETLNIVITTKAKGDGAKKTKEGLGDIVKIAKAFAGAALAKKFAETTVELIKLGATAERQANALNNLAMSAGTSGDAIVGAMQEASQFTISQMDAMAAANRAMVMDVAKTPAEFERLTKVAVALGRAMGQDATKSIDDFVTASARQSQMIADNLGLTVTVGQATERYAAQLGIAVDQLTDAQKKQAFLNMMLEEGEKKMAELGETTLDNAAKIEQAKAGWQDFKMLLGQSAAAAAEAVGWLDGLARLGTSMHRSSVSAAEGQKLLSGEIEQTTKSVMQWTQASYDSTQSHYQYQAALAATEAHQAATAAAALQLEQAELAAAVAAGEATKTHLSLAASLKDATDAQIAQAAISQLGAALAEGDITLADYNTAVGQVQLTFGLATEESMKLSEGIMGLTADLADGELSATGYDEALLALIGTTTDAATQTDQLAQELAALPSKKTIVVEYKRVITGPRPPSGAPGGGGGGGGGGGSASPGGSRGGHVMGAGLLSNRLATTTTPALMGGGAVPGGLTIGPVYITNSDPVQIWKELEQLARLKNKSGWQQLGR